MKKRADLPGPPGDREKQELFQNYLSKLHLAKDLDEGWLAITDVMKQYGFDRMIYVRKPLATFDNYQNLSGTVFLSTFADGFNQVFHRDRGYANAVGMKWGLFNSGWFNHRIAHDLYWAGKMNEYEAKVQELYHEHGILCGMNFIATPPGWHYRSGFGMSFRQGFDHDDVEAVHAEHAANMEACLKMFDIAVSLYTHIPPGNELTEKQCQVLKLASEGKTIADIAEITGWHRRTVDNHMTAARERLEVSTTLQAVMKAAMQGQI